MNLARKNGQKNTAARLLGAVCFLVLLNLILLQDAHAQTYKIYEQKMPPQWQKQFGKILDNSIKYWESKIPGTKFVLVQNLDQADFVLEWASQYDSSKLGYFSKNTVNEYGKPKLTITLGYFKDKKWNLVSGEYAQLITTHELGHAIGLPHSEDPDDIMYPLIENYENWLAQKRPAQVPKNKNIDWKAQSIKYQSLSDEQLYLAESSLKQAEALLKGTASTNKASKSELDKAWLVYWSAKKYYNDAKKSLQNADDAFYSQNYQESYLKYKASYDMAKKVNVALAKIQLYISKAAKLQ